MKGEKRFLKRMGLWGLFALCLSCSSVRWASVDRLAPAKVAIPEHVRRVAVVNNLPLMDNPQALNFWIINSSIMVDSLAQHLADARFFKEVVVLDSVLTTSEDPLSYDQRQLSSATVSQLVSQLGVDMLVSVEFAGFVPDEVMPYPLFSGTVYAFVNLYMPGKPVQTIQDSRVIYEVAGEELAGWAHRIAAEIPVPYIVPHWTTVELPYFTGANVDMRDASVYVREGNWEDARRLWQRQLSHKNIDRRLEANFNMAVWHEIHDDSIGLAHQYAQRALKEALEKKRNSAEDKEEILFISDYISDLENRGKDLERVKQQMKRFSDDF